MPDLPRVSSVRFSAASDDDIRRGFLGRLRLVVNGLIVDGVALRRTLDGRLTLAYPARNPTGGQRHFVVRPQDDDVRLSMEVQVFTKLGIKSEEMSS